MNRLPLWKLTRNPVGRAVYDRVSGRALQFASLQLYRRSATETGAEATTTAADETYSSPELTVHASVDALGHDLPYKSAEASEANLVVLGRAGGEVVGQVFLTRNEAYIHELEADLSVDGAYVWRLYVDPDYRNEGIGSQLLEGAIGAVRDRWGNQDLYALIADDNLPSRRLFEGHDFISESRFRYVRLGPISRRWRVSS